MRQDATIQYAGIEASDRAVVATDDRGRRVVVAREQVRSLRFRRASAARHPLVLALLGFALIGLGLIPFRLFLVGFNGGLHPKELLLGVWLIVGIAAVADALRRRWMLVVETAEGVTGIPFGPAADVSGLRAFARDLEEDLGYPVVPPP